jgi:hypothetical protein
MSSVINVLLLSDDNREIMGLMRIIDRCEVLCKLTIAKTEDEALRVLGAIDNASNERTMVLLDEALPFHNSEMILNSIRKNSHKIQAYLLTHNDNARSVPELTGLIHKPLDLKGNGTGPVHLMIDLLNMRT